MASQFQASDGLVHAVEDPDKIGTFHLWSVCKRYFYRGGTGSGYNPQPAYVTMEYTREVSVTCLICLSG
jgi:hypothetical protein